MVNTDSDQRGSVPLTLALVLTILLLIGAVTFVGWAYSNMLAYKKIVDAKVAAAIPAAQNQESAKLQLQFAQEERQPLQTYLGPAAYGSLKITYPKTWSAYTNSTGTGSPYIDDYFYPGVVPDINSPNAFFALRVQLVQDSYSSIMGQVASYAMQGQATVTSYAFPKQPSIVGSRIDGELPNNKGGVMIVMPLRNMTLELWTEANETKADFVNTILPNFNFSP